MRAALYQAFDRLVLEPLLLERAARRAQGYSAAQRARIRALTEAARTRHRAAEELRREEVRGAALALEREACALAITAALVARCEHEDSTALPAPAAWARLDSILDQLDDVPEALSVARPLLSSPDLLAPERQSGDPAALRDAVARTFEWLAVHCEARTPRQIVAQRRLRIAAIALAALLAIVGALAWAGRPHNLARGKSVLVSSQRVNTPDPSHVVDGSRQGTYGVHTNQDHPPWVEIDLGASYRLDRAVIVNRGDGYLDEVLPLALQISEDDRTWYEAAVRHERFTQWDPWRVELGGRSARYVRVIKPEAGYIALSEIEIYGRR
jgi:hypothetical protein